MSQQTSLVSFSFCFLNLTFLHLVDKKAGGKPAEAVKSASVVPIDMDDETTAADFSKDVKKTKRQSVSKPGNQGMKSTNPSARAEDEQNLDNDSDYDDDEDEYSYYS